jgi:hypothetical protein
MDIMERTNDMDGPLIDWLPDDPKLKSEVYANSEDINTPSRYDTHFVMFDDRILTIGSAKECARFLAQWGEGS